PPPPPQLGDSMAATGTRRAVVEDEEVGRGVKAFVALFLAVFTACGLFQLEAWPFSGWALFSHLRTDQRTAWLVTGVAADGDERPIPFSTFPAAYQGHQHVINGFDDLSPDEREGACNAWAAEWARTAKDIDIDVDEIRVYAVTDSTRHPGSGQRHLRYVCPDP
ncbi:MAG: hypothetical protein QOG82_2624, partial [Actinomycetota bacterium]|nr:hypothetical protein [Actinomycetota bacterium]